jgi:glycosyltransferase involved in cell wall biosynthesis
MKIVMAVVSDLSSDARVQREASTLAAAGHQVDVVGFDYGTRRATTRGQGGVRYRLLPFPPRGSARWRRLAGAAVFVARASATVLAARADAYHAHNLHLAVPCALAARLRRARLVYDAHELVVPMVRPRYRGLAVRYERAIWRLADLSITTNASRAGYLARLHRGPRPLVVGNYPAEPATIEPVDLRRQLGIPGHRRILIYQGGLYVADRCFDTVALALRDLPDWHWVIVGFGSRHSIQQLHDLLGSAGVADRAHVLPKVPLERLLHVTAGADLGVVPLRRVHLNNYLGDTNKLFEYLMAGIPAAGSDFPEVRRALLGNPEGPLGAVFDPTDPASIASAIKELADPAPELRRRVWELARRRFAWAGQGARLVEAYAGLSGSPGRTGASPTGDRGAR